MDGKYMEKLFGWVRFTGATAVILQSRGIVSVARNGAGDYQVVLDPASALDSTESSIHVMAEGAVQVEWSYVHTSDTSKQLLALNNAAAAVDPTTVFAKFYQNAYGTGL